MRRARRWLRRIAAVLATVAIGVMLGYLIPTIVADFLASGAAEGLGAGSARAAVYLALPRDESSSHTCSARSSIASTLVGGGKGA